jgi:bacteriocin-like protein
MLEEKNKAVELTDDELENVSGGYVINDYHADADSCSLFKGRGQPMCKNCDYGTYDPKAPRGSYRCTIQKL